jgi:DNA-binding GntR family transcriptional regulator
MLSELWNGLQPQFPDFVNFQIDKSAKEHQQIVKAITKKDKVLAKELTQKHILRSKEAFLQSVFFNSSGG